MVPSIGGKFIGHPGRRREKVDTAKTMRVAKKKVGADGGGQSNWEWNGE